MCSTCVVKQPAVRSHISRIGTKADAERHIAEAKRVGYNVSDDFVQKVTDPSNGDAFVFAAAPIGNGNYSFRFSTAYFQDAN